MGMLDTAVDQNKLEEGYRKLPYLDTEGHWTFGYGTRIDDGLEQWEAEALLRATLERLDTAIDLRLGKAYRDMNDARRAVLLGMAYQMGIEGLFRFRKTLAYIRAGEYVNASHEMLDSDWARNPALVRSGRPHRMALQMRTGEYQFRLTEKKR